MPPTVGAAVACLLAILVCAAFGERVAPLDPDVQRLLASNAASSAEFRVGTDKLAREIFSRVVVGARTAVLGPLAITFGAFAIATCLGLVAGHAGGWIDALMESDRPPPPQSS